MGSSSAFQGKVALVTGGGRGIGRAIALRLGAAGARVVVASRTGGQLDETCQLIEREGGRARAVVCDVSVEEEVAYLVEAARSEYGGVDILVNNVGVAPLGTIDQMPPASDGSNLATIKASGTGLGLKGFYWIGAHLDATGVGSTQALQRPAAACRAAVSAARKRS